MTNGEYHEKMIQKTCNIFMATKDGKVRYCHGNQCGRCLFGENNRSCIVQREEWKKEEHHGTN